MKRRIDFASKRKSAFFFRSSLGQSDPWTSLYPHMFIEDVSHNVMPIGGKSRNHPDFAIVLDPESPDIESFLCIAFSTKEYTSYSLREAVSDFITDCATQLAYMGEVHYEIVRGDKSDFLEELASQYIGLAGDSPPLFQPLLIPGRILNIANRFFQLVPMREWGSQNKFFVILSANNVWRVRLPPQLGNRVSHGEFLKALFKYSASLPEFVVFNPKNNSSLRDFSFSDFHNYHDLFIAAESSLWGWPVRQLIQRRTLEYHLVHRHLAFAYSMAILREHILHSINILLQKMGFLPRLIIKGLPTSHELREALHELELGNMSFDNALDLTNLL